LRERRRNGEVAVDSGEEAIVDGVGRRVREKARLKMRVKEGELVE